MLITIFIETMTGERWSEQISAYDQVTALKKRVFKRKGIMPSRQALVFPIAVYLFFQVFCGVSLSDDQLLIAAGVRNDSVVKFLVMTRAGPSFAPRAEEMTLSDDPSDWENKGRR